MLVSLRDPIHLPEGTQIKHREDNVTLFIDNQRVGRGSLIIAESSLSWLAESEREEDTSSHGQGFSLEYPNISLHAISKDLTTFPRECLYLMVDPQVSFDIPSSSTTAANGSSVI